MATVISFPHDSATTAQEFKQLVVRYLEGERLVKKPYEKHSTSSIEDDLRRLCTANNEASIDAKTLCNEVLVTQEDGFDEDTIAILEHLDMPTSKSRYIGSTSSLYHLLSRLRNEGHERLDYLLELIDNTRYKRNWRDRAARPALTLLGVLAFCYLEPELFWNALDWIVHIIPLIYHWLYLHLVELHNLPILGMIGQIGWGLYYLTDTFEYGLDQSDKRIRNWMFNTLAVMLNFSAHLISYWAAGALPLLPAFVFILSAWVDIVKSFFTTWQEKTPTPEAALSPHQNATRISLEQIRARDKEIFIANCVHAAAVTTLILACYFLTPSIILTITYTLALWIGLFIKDSYTKHTQQTYANKLQKELRNLYQHSGFFSEAAKEATAHQEFQDYAKTLLSQMPEYTTKRAKCIEYRETLLQEKPFYLRKSKEKFGNFCENWDHIAEALQHQQSMPSTILRPNIHSSSNSLNGREFSFNFSSPDVLRISPDDDRMNRSRSLIHYGQSGNQ